MKTAVLVFDDAAVLDLRLYALASKLAGRAVPLSDALLAWLNDPSAERVAAPWIKPGTLSNSAAEAILEHVSTPDPKLDAVRLAVIAELQASPPPPPPPPPPDPLIGQPPAAWAGDRLVAVWDMAAVKDWLHGLGYDGSTSALHYTIFTTMWYGDGWPQGSIDSGLYDRRAQLADLGWQHIDAMAPVIRAQEEGSVVAVVNDGPDRLGRRTASVTVDRLGRSGLTVQPGDTVAD